MTPLAKFFRELTILFRGMIILKIFRFMHFVLKKLNCCVRTPKAHFWAHKYGGGFQKKPKFKQNSLFGVLCLLCAYHTKIFMRQIINNNVLRYRYHYLVLPGTIPTTWCQQIRKYYQISQKKQISNTFKTRMFFQKKVFLFCPNDVKMYVPHFWCHYTFEKKI